MEREAIVQVDVWSWWVSMAMQMSTPDITCNRRNGYGAKVDSSMNRAKCHPDARRTDMPGASNTSAAAVFV